MLPLLLLANSATAVGHSFGSKILQGPEMLSMWFGRSEAIREAVDRAIFEDGPGPKTATTIALLAGAGLIQGNKRRKANRSQKLSDSTPEQTAKPQLLRHNSKDLEDAELCWSREYGRFKYCGLRDDPFAAGVPKPSYSQEPLDLRLPPLSPKEEMSLGLLEHSVADLANEGVRVDRSTLLRYLKATKGKEKKAESMFRRATKWRKDHDVDGALAHWDLEALEECLAPWWVSGGLMGHGLNGEPVAWERIGHCSWPKLCAQLPFEILQKIDLVHCMRSLGACEEDALRRGVPFLGSVMVLDLHGFGIEQAQLKAAWTLAKLNEYRSLLLPETVKTILMVRTPASFVYAWSMFSHLLDPSTKEKVQMATEADTLKMLLRYMSEDNIPAYLGGKLHIDEDPECRKILAPGGCPPLAARERLMSQMKRSGGLSRRYREETLNSASRKDDDEEAYTGRGSSFCGGCFG